MNKQIKRFFSVALVFVMLFSILSVTASAANYTITLAGGYRGSGTNRVYGVLNEKLTAIDGDTYIDENGVEYTLDKENNTITFTTDSSGGFIFPEFFFDMLGYEQYAWVTRININSGSRKYAGDTATVKKNTTYYAGYQQLMYNVDYLPGVNGVGEAVSITNKRYNSQITLENAIFTRPGYFQIGWATVENSDVIEYEFNDKFTITSNVQFYPVWEEINYDLSWSVSEINFASACIGYNDIQDIFFQIANYSNVAVTFASPQSDFYDISISNLSVGAGETASFGIAPKTELGVGTYKEKLIFHIDAEEVEDVYVEVAFNVRNHTYTDWAESIPATSDSAGVQSRYCGYCGLTETLEIPQLLCEAPVVNETIVADGSVTLCWDNVFGADSYNIYKLNASGEWVRVSTVNGNELIYTDIGITENDAVYTYAVTAINEIGETTIADSAVDVHYIIHDFGEWIERAPATCTTNGEMYRVCSTCSEEETKVIASYGGHSFPEEWVTVKAHTCTEDGEYYRVCNNCYETETKTITAQGHNYSQEWTVDVTGTCTEDGVKSRHCLNCDDKADETIIETTGHDYSLVATIDEHPHSKIFCCMNCGEEKQEDVFASDCSMCLYDTVALDDDSVQITGYNGIDIEIDVPSEIDGKTVVSISETCFRGNENIMYVALPESISVIEDNTFNGCTSLQLVDLSKNITSIGKGAFSGCTVLAEVMLYPDIVSIGDGAFDGFRGVIGCVRNSYAHNYVVENNLNYQLLDILAKENTRIDYNEKVIFTSVSECNNIDDIFEYFGDIEAVVTSRNPLQQDLYGTGTAISLFAGDEYLGDYVVVVEGDVNGDSVCDALDMFETARMSNGRVEPTQEQIYAANGNVSDCVDAVSYQNVVNIALS